MASRKTLHNTTNGESALTLMAELLALELVKLTDQRLRRMRFYEFLEDVGRRVERLDAGPENALKVADIERMLRTLEWRKQAAQTEKKE